MSSIDIDLLRNWFIQTKRDFPWRENPDPYRVLISEVMLQQTQADRVIFYFQEWMKRFPNLAALANATEPEVIKAWEGLGYYSRAKALHRAACILIEQHCGVLPQTKKELLEIKGIGEYTSSAILAFGFHKKEAPVDANVLRVFCRFFNIEDDIAKTKTKDTIRKLVQAVLPDENPWEIAESFIELGALICRPQNPKCHICPLQDNCKAYSNQVQHKIPVSSKKTIYEKLFRTVCIVKAKDHFLLRKVPENMPCAGLFEFPYFEKPLGHTQCQELLLSEFKLSTNYSQTFDTVDQSFTKYRVKLYPQLFFANEMPCVPDHEWHRVSSIKSLTFSSGHKKILNLLSW